MSKSRNNPQKRKLREKAVRQKVLVNREELRAERRAQQEEIIKERERFILEHGQVPQAKPGNPEAASRRDAEQSRKIAEKLAHNLEILKILENEYEEEQSRRNEVNEKLESEGYKTMKEKMNALHEKALRMKGDAEALAKAESDYVAQQNSDVQQK